MKAIVSDQIPMTCPVTGIPRSLLPIQIPLPSLERESQTAWTLQKGQGRSLGFMPARASGSRLLYFACCLDKFFTRRGWRLAADWMQLRDEGDEAIRDGEQRCSGPGGWREQDDGGCRCVLQRGDRVRGAGWLSAEGAALSRRNDLGQAAGHLDRCSSPPKPSGKRQDASIVMFALAS